MSLAIALALAPICSVAMAQMAVKQIQLTDKQIENFIDAQKDMGAIAEKTEGTPSDKPDPKVHADLEAAAKKHGFKDFAEYDEIAANISMVMAGIDPQTKNFLEPQAMIKKEIDEVTADKSMPDAEKKQALEELTAALKTAQPIQYASNIELVKKYFDKLDAAMQ
jgi:hypothetical protein